MFQRIFLTLLTVANIAAIYISQFYSGLQPFYFLAGSYILSSIIILSYYSLFNGKGSDFTRIAGKLLSSGTAVVYLGFLAVIDLIIFTLLVPSSSVTLLENDSQTPFVVLALLIFFIPVILIKIIIEPKGKDIENLFWLRFLEALKTTKPSTDFSLFIITRIQLKYMPMKKKIESAQAMNDNFDSVSDEISTTTFPLDYNNQEILQDPNQSGRNSLFDSELDESRENIFDKYYQEIYQLVPGVEEMVAKKPLNLRPDLLLNIIIERTLKDERLIQFFKECSGSSPIT